MEGGHSFGLKFPFVGCLDFFELGVGVSFHLSTQNKEDEK
jgi:hypothetical protein